MAYIARQRIFYNNLQHQKVLPTKSSTDDIDDNVSLGGRSLASVGSVARANVPSHEPPAAATLADAGISRKLSLLPRQCPSSPRFVQRKSSTA